MARRKRKTGLETLIELPYWLIVAFAISSYVLLNWVIPSLIGSNPLLKGLVIASTKIAPWAAAFLLIIAVISFMAEVFSPNKDLRRLSAKPLDHPEKAFSHTYSPEFKISPLSPSPDDKQSDASIEWSLVLLRRLEWKRFEALCAAYFQGLGLRAETIRCGADGGVDVKLFRQDSTVPESIVQCKAWNSRPVGVKPVRELFGVMAHEKISKGIFMTTSDYTQEAKIFAKEKPLFLIDGEKLLELIFKLPKDNQQRLLSLVTQGDYMTPSCPSCGIKMVERRPKSNVNKAFWGCSNFPRCKQTFVMKGAKIL